MTSEFTILVPDDEARQELDSLLVELAERPWVFDTPVGEALVDAEVKARDPDKG